MDLLEDKDCDCFGEFGAGFHDAKTEGDYFCREEEFYCGRGVGFYEGADDAEGGEAEVLEGTGFGGCVEEGVEKERDVR